MNKPEEVKELDCSNAGRGCWLVKVPKYIAKKWLKGKVFRYFAKSFSFLNLWQFYFFLKLKTMSKWEN